MKTEQEIKDWIKSLKSELKDPNRDDIDKENIQDEIDILLEVLK